MLSPTILVLIYAADSNIQQHFLTQELSPISDGFSGDLNSGILNYFDFTTGRTNCADASAVFTINKDDRTPFLEYSTVVLRFWSCTFYPNLTHNFRELRLPNKNRTFLLDNEIDTSVSSAENVTSFLSTCLVAWCEGSKGCATPSCTLDRLTISGTMLSAADVRTCLDSICSVSPERLSSPDILGIGILCSIAVQFVIAIGGLLSLIVCSILRRMFWAHLVRRQRIQAIMDTVAITLDEFQRAQCCFAIAIDIASLIILHDKAQKVRQIDRMVIGRASTAGIIPTTMNLAVQMLVIKQHSHFTFLLTFITWILSLIVKISPKEFYRDDDMYKYVDTRPAACGMNSPVYVCNLNQVIRTGYDSFTLIAIGAMVILTYWQWSPLIPCLRSNTTGSKPDCVDTFRDRFILLALILSLSSSSGFFLVSVADNIRRGDVNMEWSFGQIVAVSIWLPTLLSFINDCIYGPLQGRTNQLPLDLQVVRTNSLGSQSAHTSAQDIAQSGSNSSPRPPVPIVNRVVNFSTASSVELQYFSSGANGSGADPVSDTSRSISGGSVQTSSSILTYDDNSDAH